MKNFEKKYAALSVEQKQILFLLSILFTKCEQTTLYQLVTESNLQNERHHPMTFREISTAVQGLKAKGFISLSNECTPSIREKVMTRACESNVFCDMLEIIKQINANFNIHCFREETILSNLRIAIYTNNDAFLAQSLENYEYASWHNSIFVEIVLLLGGWEKCLTLSPKVAVFLLQNLIIYNVVHLKTTPNEIISFLHLNKPLLDDVFKCEEVDFVSILQGKFSIVEKQLTSESYLSWVSFHYARNDLAEGKAYFVQALKQVKVQKMRMPSLHGIFLCLFMLQRNEKKHAKALEKIIDANILFDSGYQNCYRALQAVKLWLGNDKEKASETLATLKKETLSLFDRCVVAICNFWIDAKTIQKKSLQDLQSQLVQSNYDWLQEQVQYISMDLHFSEPKDFKWPLFKLTKRWQKHTPWKNVLKSLQKLAENIDIVEKRLAWFIEPGPRFCQITAREQKKRADNTWSPGRNLEINLDLDEDYLSVQDKKILVAYLENQHRYEYGHWKKVLIEMAQHPYVFHTQKNHKVDIAKKQPQLAVTKQNKEIKLAFLESNDNENIYYNRESDSKISMIKFEQIHTDIAGVLKEKGNIFPIEAEKELKELCSLFSQCATIHSYDEICGNKIELDERIYVRLTPWEQGFRIDIVVKPMGNNGPVLKPGEGGKVVIAHVKDKQCQVKRNLKKEIQFSNQILEQCHVLREEEYCNWEWTIGDVEKCLQLLLSLRKIKYVKIEWPQGKKLKIHEQIGWDDLQAKVSKKKDWFELDATVELSEHQVVKMKDLLIHIENSPDNYIALNDEEFVLLTTELRRKLEELKNLTRVIDDKIQIHPLASSLINAHLTQLKTLQTPESWISHIKKWEKIEQQPSKATPKVNATLRSYQQQGFKWLVQLDEKGVGGCLADDMGLGKTIQALAFIRYKSEKGPSLVIAPTSVAMNWEEEAKKFTPDLDVQTFTSSSKNELLSKLTCNDLLITSYGILQNRPQAFTAINWQTIVLDEAQAIKNSNTKRSQIAMLLQGKFKLITTGTPIENHLGELWNLFQFINPGFLGSQENFRQKYIVPIEKDNDESRKKALRRLVQPFILRRLKKDVLKELPPRIENTLYVETSEDERHFYEALRQKAVSSIDSLEDNKKHFKILAEIMKLRRACCHPLLVDRNTKIASSKMEAFAALLEEVLQNNHRVLIFSQFVQYLSIIREHLEQSKISYQYLDGSTPQKERKRNVDNFQKGIGDVFLISLKAGGMGINLTGADYVIHMDPWWNPAVEDQAADRAHRLGQTKPVNIYRLVTKGTIEQKILKLHAQKKELAESILSESHNVGKINVAELLHLIQS